jgi:oligoribonuclease NrnB/cAMP/cGMP phosphodiesterase (DHH superfamily)
MTYHISHIDTDGYGCQYVASKAIKDIKFINANYNKSIEDTLNNLFLEFSSMSNPQEHQILITDINLTMELADKLDNFSKHFNVQITLLDHHGTGKDVADKYQWYHLSEEVCATKLTYQYFYPILQKNLTEEELTNLDFVVETVDKYDLWKENDPLFLGGKLLNSLILDNKSRFSKLIEGEMHNYIFHIFDSVGAKLGKDSIAKIEKDFYDISKAYLNGKISDDYFYNENYTLDYLYNRFVFETVKDNIFPIIEFNGHKGHVFSDMYNGLFQDFSHFYLNEIPDVDFAVHFSDRGQLSFRSIGDVDVSAIASTYFGGGGHPNASGASFGERLSNVKVAEALSLFEKAKQKILKNEKK